MKKSIIAALDQNNGIGYQNRMPWHLPAELQHFKGLTMGHHLIMGRKTYESIGKPLPGRTTIIVTRNRTYQAEGCLVTHSVLDAIKLADEHSESEVFICGGESIYRNTLIEADRLYITRIHAEFQTDTTFPDFDVSLWQEIGADFHPVDEKNPYPFTFHIYERK